MAKAEKQAKALFTLKLRWVQLKADRLHARMDIL